MPEIVPLPRERYEGYEVPFDYVSDWYYDVRVLPDPGGFAASFVLTPFPETVHKRFVDKLYQPHWDAPEAYGVREGETLAAILEITPETWNNRLRVANLWVNSPCRRRGLGRLLMDRAKAIARERGHRALVLETQSCNAPAVAFYLAQGFTLAGFDLCAYTNTDAARKEVRLEMSLLLP